MSKRENPCEHAIAPEHVRASCPLFAFPAFSRGKRFPGLFFGGILRSLGGVKLRPALLHWLAFDC